MLPDLIRLVQVHMSYLRSFRSIFSQLDRSNSNKSSFISPSKKKKNVGTFFTNPSHRICPKILRENPQSPQDSIRVWSQMDCRSQFTGKLRLFKYLEKKWKKMVSILFNIGFGN